MAARICGLADVLVAQSALSAAHHKIKGPRHMAPTRPPCTSLQPAPAPALNLTLTRLSL